MKGGIPKQVASPVHPEPGSCCIMIILASSEGTCVGKHDIPFVDKHVVPCVDDHYILVLVSMMSVQVIGVDGGFQ